MVPSFPPTSLRLLCWWSVSGVNGQESNGDGPDDGEEGVAVAGFGEITDEGVGVEDVIVVLFLLADLKYVRNETR